MRNTSFRPTRNRIWTAARFAAHSIPPRVLVVDDFIDSADSLAAFLASTGFDTHVAYNGCDALKIVNEWHPDGVVLDVAMPCVSGLAVARTLRASPETASVPLLAYTAYETDDNFDELRAGGFDAVCAKPVDPMMIVKILTLLIGTAPTNRTSSLDS
ncbi:Response regulator receiver protein [Paraburkholderia piptadeniae]|uniref:Response regulator receiver protein n=1 Tax=Paraburkholderia piptadeniae TaxID=1701573 RepID=A0A1N7RNS2_9BURK|nr:Response regulator receiver protein [Paraburkholderia piptadeniae]